MKKKFVLFDFDGVIADTEKSNAVYLQKALSFYGISLTEEDIRALIGTRNEEYIRNLLSRAPYPVTLEDLRQKRLEIGNTYEDGELCAEAGIKHLLEYLRKRGVKTALVSSTFTKLIITALNRLQMTDLFDVIVCGDMCRESKPNPEGYKRAMDHLNADPEECVVIEDSPAGILAGKRAGAYVMAYTGGSMEQDVGWADHIIRSFEDIEDIIEQL